MNAADALAAARLYAIFDCHYAAPSTIEHTLKQLIAGGAQVVQLRAKNLSQVDILKLAHRAVTILKDHGVPFIVNDFPSIAAEVEADGAHIGQDDGDLKILKKQYPGLIIGRSTHTIPQVIQAAREGADYIGFGPLFPTPTKAGRDAIGLEHIRAAHENFKRPIFCIGGIKTDNLPEVLAAGARSVVMVSGILQSPDITATCRKIRSMLDNYMLAHVE